MPIFLIFKSCQIFQIVSEKSDEICDILSKYYDARIYIPDQEKRIEIRIDSPGVSFV
jgi:hypothetical protein